MTNALEVRGLNKSYDTFSLKDVSFEIPGLLSILWNKYYIRFKNII